MARKTLAEIVAAWERQLHVLESSRLGFESAKSRKGVKGEEFKSEEALQRTYGRIEVVKDHIRELQQYAMERAR